IGSSCGRHGSYTFYKGFRIISGEKVKNYCLGEFYFVRKAVNLPICIAELQLIWHDSGCDSKLASARLYFKPEDTPQGRLSIHGKDELLYAEQKVVIKCEDMLRWEYCGPDWRTGLVPTCTEDLIPTNDTRINSYNSQTEQTCVLRESQNINNTAEKLIILTFQAYCRYASLKKRLQEGLKISKSELTALGGIISQDRATRIVFCRESFSCTDIE
ncbi:predicted protein, partial [Nematostella vectensis]